TKVPSYPWYDVDRHFSRSNLFSRVAEVRAINPMVSNSAVVGSGVAPTPLISTVPPDVEALMGAPVELRKIRFTKSIELTPDPIAVKSIVSKPPLPFTAEPGPKS